MSGAVAVAARPGCRGSAFPLALAVALLVLMGSVALGTLGRVHLAKARAQTGADLAALSAASELRSALAAPLGPDGADRARLRARVAGAARAAAGSRGGRVVAMELPGGAWPPAAVQVTVALAGPMGSTVTATARAALAAPAGAPGGPVGLARGGAYAGPLWYRDGKPACPAVIAAFDLMDAAARAEGVDLAVASGFRSDAEQAVLFAAHPDPRWVARPGESRHRDATELDLATGGGAGEWLRRRAGEFGFVQRYSWEPWHFGYVAGCGGGGPAAPAPVPAYVPAEYAALVSEAAAANGVPPALLAALLQSESGFNPRAVSAEGAQGMAQFMPATARGMGLADPFDPRLAIPAAARLLAGHLRAFGSVPLALAAYNAGSGAVRRYGGVPPYAETQAYVVRVMALAGGALGAPAAPGGVRLVRAGGLLV
jgi:hypothetical protein